MVGIGAAPSAVFAPASLYADMPSQAPNLLVEASSTPTATIITPEAPRPRFAPNNRFRNADGDCSCVVYARSRLPDLPRINTPADLKPNQDTPVPGYAILLAYKLAHIAIIEETTPEGILISEVNYSREEVCQTTMRLIRWTDPAIRGYYHPSP